ALLGQSHSLTGELVEIAGLGVAGAELDRAVNAEPATSDNVGRLARKFHQWQGQLEARHALVVIDEVQHLATSPQFLPFTAALRTLLDTAPANIHVLFTASSNADLRKLLNAPDGPFFDFVVPQDFPVLGAEFIRFICARFQALSGRVLDEHKLQAIHKASGHDARRVLRLVKALLLRPECTLVDLYPDSV
ncbi:hypothetical protein, partial [Chitinolyticbacter albus]|uniref:hypothetical protein n=1 Tax=Chitinolyticbacter albus TaxID=2961951 RepID=UPI00210A6AAD